MLGLLFGVSLIGLGAGLGAGLAVLGGGLGISRIGVASSEAIARQPEAADNIRGNALILAALIEGATLFGVVVTLLLTFRAQDFAPGS